MPYWSMSGAGGKLFPLLQLAHESVRLLAFEEMSSNYIHSQLTLLKASSYIRSGELNYQPSDSSMESGSGRQRSLGGSSLEIGSLSSAVIDFNLISYVLLPMEPVHVIQFSPIPPSLFIFFNQCFSIFSIPKFIIHSGVPFHSLQSNDTSCPFDPSHSPPERLDLRLPSHRTPAQALDMRNARRSQVEPKSTPLGIRQCLRCRGGLSMDDLSPLR